MRLNIKVFQGSRVIPLMDDQVTSLISTRGILAYDISK